MMAMMIMAVVARMNHDGDSDVASDDVDDAEGVDDDGGDDDDDVFGDDGGDDDYCDDNDDYHDAEDDRDGG